MTENSINENESKEDTDIYTYKIILLGDSSVGKTSMIIRFCDGEFNGEGTATVGIDTKTKYLKRNGKKIELGIWDTAGQERFRSLAKNFYTAVDGILLVFDEGNKSSFKHIKNWVNEINNNIDIKQVSIIIVGNKCDLEEQEVEMETVIDFCNQQNLKFFETSAKADINIIETFGELIDEMVKKDSESKQKIKRNKSRIEKYSSASSDVGNKKKKCCK